MNSFLLIPNSALYYVLCLCEQVLFIDLAWKHLFETEVSKAKENFLLEFLLTVPPITFFTQIGYPLMALVDMIGYDERLKHSQDET